MANGVLIIAEAAGDALRPVSLELVTAGRKVAAALGQPLKALIIGSGVSEAAQQLATAGVDEVLVADDARLAGMMADAVVAVATSVIKAESPSVVLVPVTTAGSDIAPRTAVRLGVGLAADAIDLSTEGGSLVVTRPVLGDRVITTVKLAGGLQMATVRSGAFDKAALGSGSAPVRAIPVELTDADLRVTYKGTEQVGAGAAKLDDADIVVAGGRGLKEAENFSLVEQLAQVLGAATAASRAIVDAGWRPHDEQIGQTGRTVSPRLYIAVGISGAVQHNVGMQGSEFIVAINRDPDAPIFKIAAFGIVGDLFEVVPAIIAELQAAS